MIVAVGLGAAGTIAYVNGDLQAAESEPIDVVYEAALKAVKDLELPVTSHSKGALVAEIITYDAQDRGKKESGLSFYINRNGAMIAPGQFNIRQVTTTISTRMRNKKRVPQNLT